MFALIVLLAVVIILVLLVASAYNRCVALSNQVEEASSQIDVQLKMRYDLIPNLVETAKGYAAHEQNTLTSVIAARNAAVSAQGTMEKDKADRALDTALRSVFALSESYPELKANENFIQLQKQLTSIEGSILNARKYYNAVVKTFNTTIQTFPTSVIVGLFGTRFSKLEYLKVSEEEKQNVKVSF